MSSKVLIKIRTSEAGVALCPEPVSVRLMEGSYSTLEHVLVVDENTVTSRVVRISVEDLKIMANLVEYKNKITNISKIMSL